MDQLPNAVAYSDNNKAPAGQLNPDWVEWLMGWAIGWTSMESITELDWRDWSVDPANEGEVPRVSTGIKNRVGRLKAIGNGQVPQVAAMAWKILTK
jgi:DNA (cytosine-5)-methyltransferase 1